MVVDDLDATEKMIEKHGGQIIDEVTIPNIGRWFHALDNQGALFAPFQAHDPAQLQKPSFPPALGHFCWHELMAKDYTQAMAFYQAVFGWKTGDAVDLGPMGTYQMYQNTNLSDDPTQATMGGIMNITADMQGMQPTWVEYLHVQDVDETVKRAQDLGGQISFPAMDIEGGKGRVGGIVDNQGVSFAVWHSNV